MIHTLYHLSHIKNYRLAFHGKDPVKLKQGIGIKPSSQIHGSQELCIYAFPEDPEKWGRKYEYIFGQDDSAFEKLLYFIGKQFDQNVPPNIVQLEIDIDVKDETITVGDYGHLEARALIDEQKDLSRIPQNYKHGSLTEANQSYQQSLVSIETYLNNPKSFFIPEVHIKDLIPPERIRVSSHQPYLLRGLEGTEASNLKEFIALFTPELLKLSDISNYKKEILTLRKKRHTQFRQAVERIKKLNEPEPPTVMGEIRSYFSISRSFSFL